MKRTRAVGLAGLLLLTGGAGLLVGAAARSPNPPETLQWLGAYGDAIATIEKQYIKPVDAPKLVRASLSGLLRSLDAHSDYYPPESFDRTVLAQRAKGDVGLQLANAYEVVVVSNITQGSPAARAGLQAGDVLLAIDDQAPAGDGAAGALRQLRGEPGAVVKVTVLRDGRPMSVELTRTAAASAPADAASRMVGDVAYVALHNLDQTAEAQVRDAVRGLRAQHPGLKGLVLDLRNCPGGLLDQTVGVADLFLNDGTILMQAGRDPSSAERYNARPGDEVEGLPVVVLVNAGTAGAAEFLAGALQDRGRAKLVGERTFGYGTIQTVFPLRSGLFGALKFTTSSVRLPSGRMTQKTGVQPDLAVSNGAVAPGVQGLPIREDGLPFALDLGAPPVATTPAETPPKGYAGDYQLARAIAMAGGPALKP